MRLLAILQSGGGQAKMLCFEVKGQDLSCAAHPADVHVLAFGMGYITSGRWMAVMAVMC